MRALRARVIAIAKFSFVPGFSLLSTVLILPLVSSQFGESGWIALGVGQSVGAFASVIVSLGWPVVGANSVASASEHERQLICLESFTSRGLALLICSGPTAWLAFTLVAANRPEAAIFALATALNGFTFSWYYAGVSRPGLLIRNESLIRLVGNALSLPLLYVTKSLGLYALLLLVVGLAMMATNLKTTISGPTWAHLSFKKSWRLLVEHLPLTGARTTVAAGQYLGSPIIARNFPPLLATFSALDRIQKSACNATDAVPSGLAFWVSEHPSGSNARRRRVGHAFAFSITITVCVALLWIPMADPVTRFLFAGAVRPGSLAQILNGVAIAAYLGATCLAQLVMVPIGRVRAVTVGSALGAILTILVFLVGPSSFGLPGAIAGAGAGQTLSMMIYVAVYARWRRLIPDSVEK